MYSKKPVLRSRTHVPAARGRGQERDGVLIGRGREMDVDSLPICNSRVQANRPGPSSRADAAWSAPWKAPRRKGYHDGFDRRRAIKIILSKGFVTIGEARPAT